MGNGIIFMTGLLSYSRTRDLEITVDITFRSRLLLLSIRHVLLCQKKKQLGISGLWGLRTQMMPPALRYTLKCFLFFSDPCLSMVDFCLSVYSRSALLGDDQEPSLLCKICLPRQQLDLQRQIICLIFTLKLVFVVRVFFTGTVWRTLEVPHGRGTESRWVQYLPLCSLNPMMGLLQETSLFSCSNTHFSICQTHYPEKRQINRKI